MPHSAADDNIHVIRFGVFEADLETGELRKNGVKVRLQEQPFVILKLLLAEPGQVVSRERLRNVLWPVTCSRPIPLRKPRSGRPPSTAYACRTA
jgi:DNA-binding response OmpR family regulator